MSSYRVEQILRDVRDNNLSEYEAKRMLEREIGDCDCMRDNIQKAVRDVEHGYDPWSVRRRLETEQDQCEIDDRRRKSYEEGW